MRLARALQAPVKTFMSLAGALLSPQKLPISLAGAFRSPLSGLEESYKLSMSPAAALLSPL